VSATPLSEAAPGLAQAFGTPLYVYDEGVLRSRCRALREAFPPGDFDVLYALKANSNPEILRVVRDEGLGADAVSLGEALLARDVGFGPGVVSFNGNNVGDDELRGVIAAGIHVCVDGLAQLDRLIRLGHRAPVAVRLNPDVGAGHHGHVVTGGREAKFGLAPEELPRAVAAARAAGLGIDGVQQHIGSGILDVGVFLVAADALLAAAALVPALRYVDFGGGFGVPYAPGERPFDLAALARELAPRIAAFRTGGRRDVVFRIEPGRFVVAECGSLLVRVTAVKRTRTKTFVGTDSGFNHLARPMLYGAWHAIENVSNPRGRVETVSVAGNVCESGDLFASDRPLPEAREGDLLVIRDAGAYGYSMASTYNTRPRPAEVMLSAAGPRLIRRRETLDDLRATFVADAASRAP
jgi:diaminopimelate decarboxylase